MFCNIFTFLVLAFVGMVHHPHLEAERSALMCLYYHVTPVTDGWGYSGEQSWQLS